MAFFVNEFSLPVSFPRSKIKEKISCCYFMEGENQYDVRSFLQKLFPIPYAQRA